MEHVLAGGGQGGDGPAMEGVLQGDDGASACAVFVIGILPAELNHTLVCLTAAVGKEGALHAGAGGELMGQLDIGLRVEQVGDMAQLGGLIGDGLEPLLVAVAQAVDANAGGEVNIFFALGGIQGSALAMVDGNGESAIGLHHALGVEIHQFFACHRCFILSVGAINRSWCRHRHR